MSRRIKKLYEIRPIPYAQSCMPILNKWSVKDMSIGDNHPYFFNPGLLSRNSS